MNLYISPFSEFERVEKYLTYHEKRGLAEQLSLNLRIQLTDIFSSFEPGIDVAEQSFTEKFKLTKTEASDGSELVVTQDPNVIQLPLFNKRTLIANLVFRLLFVFFLSGFPLVFDWLVAGGRISKGAYSLATSFLLIGLFLSAFTIPKFSKDKILITDGSITLTRRNIFGTRKIFSSSVTELKDISIVSAGNSTRIVFRNDSRQD